ncbi:outer membrane lipid asymmetry maintenance protein MlaD [Cognatiyoonia sp.]|uniref:outer membrane lipid asymmetry maintenance protein MlaD n=1 Tax=Cognatiyoonia sp. TaxID=2211652 RepID=UPI003F6960F7
MRENGAEVATGAIVLAAAVGFVIYTLQLTGFGAGSRSYDLSASFRSIEGIDVGTEVRLAGVKIGNVSDISLNSETFRGDATLTISRGAEIPNDSSAVVASEGILGGNFVEIVPGGSFDVYAPGDEILDTQGAVSLISLLLKFVSGEGDR